MSGASAPARPLRVAIWGLGLMGGSLAKALRAGAQALLEEGLVLEQLIGLDARVESLEEALAEGCIDAGFVSAAPRLSAAAAAALGAADVVYLALPMPLLPDCARAVAAVSGALLSDLGSVKTPLAGLGKELRFVGGHPMAGSERRGYACGSARLFENAPWVFTPERDAAGRALPAAEDLALLMRLAAAVGARPLQLDAERHDRAVARVSHLPHVVAAALARGLAGSGDEAQAELAAGGFKDMTRIASGDPALWAGICRANRPALAAATRGLIADLEDFLCLLEGGEGELREFFALASAFRASLPERASGALAAPSLLMLDVRDQPGELARVTKLLGEAGVNIKNIALQDSRSYEDGVLRIYLADAPERARAAALLAEVGYVVY